VLHFSTLTAPLTALCSPRAKFSWGPTEQQNFDALKAALTSAPVLRVGPGPADAPSDQRAGARSVGHPGAAGRLWRVPPRRLRVAQADAAGALVPPLLLELLAVVHAFKTLRPYLLDKPFELHTDNASLQWLQQQWHLSHHQARWLNLLAEFQYRVVHIPGLPIRPTSSRGSASPTASAQRGKPATPSRTRASSSSPTTTPSPPSPRCSSPPVPSLIPPCSSVLTLWSSSRPPLPSDLGATGGGDPGDPGEHPRLVPPLLRAPRRAPLPPEPATGSSTAGARAATACASPPAGSCGCSVSRAPLGLVAGPARGRRTCRAALRASASKPTTCALPACSSRYPSRHAGAAASAWTSSNS
jgi:hypothetical protein